MPARPTYSGRPRVRLSVRPRMKSVIFYTPSTRIIFVLALASLSFLAGR